LGEHTSLGPKATAPITVICLPPDLTLGVSSRTYSGVDTRLGAIKFVLSRPRALVNRAADLHAQISILRTAANHGACRLLALGIVGAAGKGKGKILRENGLRVA